MISRNSSLCLLMASLLTACLPLAASAQSPGWAAAPSPGPNTARVADAALFNDLGGLPVIKQVVDDFVSIMLADQRISFTFEGANLPRLREKLVEQFCDLSGGGCTYTGDPMKEVHQGLKLTNAHFNALVEDLQVAMNRAGIASRTQNRLLALLAPMQRDTVTR